MSGNDVRVAVLGAGIAGLTLAAALDRAGIAHEVYEQAARRTEVGAGIQLAPNAVRLLDRLGLADYLRSVAVRIDAIEMRRWDDGSTILLLPLGAECERVFGAAYYTVCRAGLLSGLHRLVPPATVQMGRKCVRVDHGELVFADGVVAADVVVGADGIHSVVRDRIARDDPRFSGQTIYRGLVPADRVAGRRGGARVELFLGPGRHAVVYPVDGGRLLSFAATAPASGWIEESWAAAGSVAELMAAYQGWHQELLSVLAAADSVRRWALHDRDTIPRWSASRLTLVGDAAHPMLPFFAQGANQAIEDAVVLARCLAAARHDVPSALAGYERERRPRTERIHRGSRENDQRLHLADGTAQRHRDRELADGGRLSAQEWLYGYDAEQVPARAG